MKTALLADVYAALMVTRSAAEYPVRLGGAKVLFATSAKCGGNDPFNTFARIAEETAKPTAAPELRRKLRFEVMTARCAFGQWA